MTVEGIDFKNMWTDTKPSLSKSSPDALRKKLIRTRGVLVNN